LLKGTVSAGRTNCPILLSVLIMNRGYELYPGYNI
jgi:hypothetical protein